MANRELPLATPDNLPCADPKYNCHDTTHCVDCWLKAEHDLCQSIYDTDMEAKDKELKSLREKGIKYDHEIEQVLGKALGYPWFKDDQKNFPGTTEVDGVCVGEHVAASIAIEAAEKIISLKAIVLMADEVTAISCSHNDCLSCDIRAEEDPPRCNECFKAQSSGFKKLEAQSKEVRP